jgi:hypothetical protein
MESDLLKSLYEKLLEIKKKIDTFEKELLAEKVKKFTELKNEENKILQEIIKINEKTIEQRKETTLDVWTLLHTP